MSSGYLHKSSSLRTRFSQISAVYGCGIFCMLLADFEIGSSGLAGLETVKIGLTGKLTSLTVRVVFCVRWVTGVVSRASTVFGCCSSSYSIHYACGSESLSSFYPLIESQILAPFDLCKKLLNSLAAFGTGKLVPIMPSAMVHSISTYGTF